jgi:hypothetical protein
MNPIDITITKYKVIAACIALAVAMAAAAAAGAIINGWRLDGEHQRAIGVEKTSYATLLAQHNDLKIKVEKQNGSVELLASKTESADLRRQQAEKWAAGVVATTNKTIAEIKASKATTCDGVLRDAWGKQ